MNIEPVGGDFGLFVLKPLTESLFTVGKAGDYEDFTLLTDRTAKTLQVPGWPQFVVRGVAFFEESIAEAGRVTVVDLTRLKILYSDPAEGEIAHWYLTTSGVLFTLIPDERQPHPPAFIWNTQKRTFTRTAPPASLPSSTERYPVWQLSPRDEECGERQTK